MPRSWRSLSSIATLLVEKVEHGVGEGFRLLDIRNMRSIERDQLGALDLLRNRFAGRRRRRRILLADNDERRGRDLWIAGAEIHVADRLDASDIARRIG